MRFSHLVAAATLGFPLTHAVNIQLYWDIFAVGCSSTTAYSECSNIEAGVCCTYSSDLFEAQATSLYTEYIPNQFTLFDGSVGQCGTACESQAGSNSYCSTCSGGFITGASWFNLNTKRGAAIEPITRTVLADRIGLYDTSLGHHRLFNISAGVPAEIIAELDLAGKNNTRAEDVNSTVLPYEIY